MGKLTVRKIEAAKPQATPYRLNDGEGLYLQVQPSPSAPGGAAKSWVLRYRLGAADKVATLGRYPGMSLAEARAEAGEKRKAAGKGFDLTKLKRAEKAQRIAANANTVQGLCEAYLAAHAKRWSQRHLDGCRGNFEKHIFPRLGDFPADQLTRELAAAVLNDIRGPVIRHRVAQLLSLALDEAAEFGRVPANVAAGLPRALARRRPQSHQINHARALSEAELRALLVTLDEFDPLKVWQPARRLLRLLLMLGLRGAELRCLTWNDVDLEAARITIPAGLMKKRLPHESPLPRQAIAILREQHALTGRSPWVFRSERGGKPMVPSGLNNALRIMGLDCSPHDLRATFRTHLAELGYALDTIRRQQAHSLGAIDAIYDQAQRIEARAAMLQRWADTLDRVRAGGPIVESNVTPLRPRVARGAKRGGRP